MIQTLAMKRNKLELPQELPCNKININNRHKREARCCISIWAGKRVSVGAVAHSQHSALVQDLSSLQHIEKSASILTTANTLLSNTKLSLQAFVFPCPKI